MGRENLLDQSYINSHIWRCDMAPIDPDFPAQVEAGCGAHYWVYEWSEEDRAYLFRCTYCDRTRNPTPEKRPDRNKLGKYFVPPK